MSDQAPQPGRYHAYESNPVPWWIALIWVSFLIFGVVYMIVNLQA